MRSKLKNTKPLSSKSKLVIEAEKRHIQAHLALTELRLRAGRRKNTANRQTVLNILHEYWKSGVFPANTYKTYKRTPVFVDDKKTYCAVGYLMAQTGYSSMAHEIDRDDKFALVENLHSRKAESWLAAYGLSREEAALIQPGYGGFVIERVSYSLQDKMLAVITLVASLLLVAFVMLALRLLKGTAGKPKKRNYFLGLAGASALIIAGLIFYLPTPRQAVSALTSAAGGKETITCGGWNTPKSQRPAVCNEFEEKGGVSGWRLVPCEGVCLR